MNTQQEWALNSIIDTGQCAKCGTCTILCPNNILTFQDTPKLTSPCLRKGRGTCHEVCPRVSSGRYQIEIREKLKNEIYTTPYTQEEALKKIISTLLEQNKIDGAIIVGEDHWKSLSLIIKDKDDLKTETHENNYKESPLKALEELGKLDLERIAIAALPCQIRGFRKIQYFPYLAKHDLEQSKQGKPIKIPEIKYLIGQFCTDKYNYGDMTQVLKDEGINLNKVKKFKLEVPKLKIDTTEKTYTLPLKPIHMNEGCKLCDDYEAELADISLGVSKNNTTNIIIRKDELDIFKNILDLTPDTEDLPKNKREHKKNRFKTAVKNRQENNQPISYYWNADYPGVGKQADGNYFIRLIIGKAGWYTTEEMQKIIDIANQYHLRLKITDRAGYELHDIKPELLTEMVEILNKNGLASGTEGPLVRVTLACPGSLNCKSGIIPSTTIAEKIDEEFGEYPTPYKFKPAVTGCPNQCVRPNIHDFGIMGLKYTKINEDKCENCGRCNEVCKKEAISYEEGVAKRNTDLCVTCGNCSKACPYDAIEITGIGYRVFIGGKSGRETVEGKEIDLKSEEELYPLLEKVLIAYNKLADKPQRERLAATIQRIGYDKFMEEVNSIQL